MWRTCSASVAALVLAASYIFGPGLPASDAELQAAFAGSRVVLCGASYGIGAELAYGLARANASLLLVARSTDKLQGVAARCGELGASSVQVLATDLSSKDGSQEVLEVARAKLGGVDMLVLNHVIGMYTDWSMELMKAHNAGSLEKPLDTVDRIFSTNILSYIYLSSFALPMLAASPKGGRLLVVGSAAGRVGMPRTAPYSASKHAVFGYFDSLRHDLEASPEASLRALTITQGVLGAFSTESARSATKGKADHLPWKPPSVAADALLCAAARRWREVFTPWALVKPTDFLHRFAPSTMDWVVRTVALYGET